jgi:hypothetical protein
MSEPLKILDPHNVDVTFASAVGGSGFLNGVINLTLVTTRWTPEALGAEMVPPDLVVSSRLRFDLKCAQDIRDALNAIIEANTKPTSKPN